MLTKIIAFASLLMIPTLVLADENLAQEAGPLEVTASGSGDNNRSFNTGGFTADAGIGYFVSPNIELAVRDGASYESAPTGHTWDNTVRGAVDFNLPLNAIEPYIGGNVGYFSSTQVRSSPEAAPELGLKVFFNKTAFVFAQAEYDFFWNRSDTTFNSGQFNYLLGVGLRF
jgi:hypothetical protein